jgi:hypothetical protein
MRYAVLNPNHDEDQDYYNHEERYSIPNEWIGRRKKPKRKAGGSSG